MYREHLGEVGGKSGLEIVYVNADGDELVADPRQAWNTVALVRYPSRQRIGALVRDPRYRAGGHVRRAALIESVLQPTVQVALS